MKQQRIENTQYVHRWKEFSYMGELTKFFDENPKLQLISFCLGRQNKFVAVYNEPVDFSSDNKQQYNDYDH